MPYFTPQIYAANSPNMTNVSPGWVAINRDPTAYDVNYSLYQFWVNTTDGSLWYLNNFSSSTGEILATWIPLSKSVSLFEFLQGNTGGLVAPDSQYKIQILGSGFLTVAGNAAASTLTISDSSNFIGTVTTNGLETKTILTIPTVANSTTTFQANLAGYATPIAAGSPGGIGGFLSATFLSGAATTASVDVPDLIQHSFVSASATFSTTGSGLNIIIQVTGDVAYNINWKGTLNYISVG